MPATFLNTTDVPTGPGNARVPRAVVGVSPATTEFQAYVPGGTPGTACETQALPGPFHHGDLTVFQGEASFGLCHTHGTKFPVANRARPRFLEE